MISCPLCDHELEIITQKTYSIITHDQEDNNCPIGDIEIYHTDRRLVERAFQLMIGVKDASYS